MIIPEQLFLRLPEKKKIDSLISFSIKYIMEAEDHTNDYNSEDLISLSSITRYHSFIKNIMFINDRIIHLYDEDLKSYTAYELSFVKPDTMNGIVLSYKETIA